MSASPAQRAAALEKRKCVCVICGIHFLAKDGNGRKVCSKPCGNAWISKRQIGTKQSKETCEKRKKSRQEWIKNNPEKEKERKKNAKASTQSYEYRLGALKRWERQLNLGIGIASKENSKLTRTINKWVMKKAREALGLETDFNDLWKEKVYQKRLENPYDAPLDSSDYFYYLSKIGKIVSNDPEIRKFQDDFMREAIPRFYKEWKDRK